jgi:hypothetical protein
LKIGLDVVPAKAETQYSMSIEITGFPLPVCTGISFAGMTSKGMRPIPALSPML